MLHRNGNSGGTLFHETNDRSLDLLLLLILDLWDAEKRPNSVLRNDVLGLELPCHPDQIFLDKLSQFQFLCVRFGHLCEMRRRGLGQAIVLRGLQGLNQGGSAGQLGRCGLHRERRSDLLISLK